jgi:hypothetical protein
VGSNPDVDFEFILFCEEAIHLVYGTSVFLLRWPIEHTEYYTHHSNVYNPRDKGQIITPSNTHGLHASVGHISAIYRTY